MSRVILAAVCNRPASSRSPTLWLLFGLPAALMASGCAHEAEVDFATEAKPPSVELINPPVRTIVRIVGQPSFIESYERTSIFPKVTGYIKEWVVDIGDKVKKDQPLAYLFVPELEEDLKTKTATVELDQQRVELARKIVEVADANVRAAAARLKEAKAILDKYEADVVRWDSEVTRLDREVKSGIVDAQILVESRNQLKATTATRDAAKATIEKAEAELLSDQASLAQAVVNVKVAQASWLVAQSEEKRLKAWVGYLTLPAPFDGVIIARNANTFDFVLPEKGDPSANERSPNMAPGGTAAPIYVVDRTDIVRIFVDIPEQDANYVQVGTKATVLAKGYRDTAIPGSVTRTSWALNVKSRTLRAEIDLKNPNSQLLPGMYAYAKVIIERPGVRALPLSALTHSGDETYCWEYDNGHAVRTQIDTGVSDGEWIEVTNRLVPASLGAPTDSVEWKPFYGSEQIILGDLAALTDGAAVEVVARPTQNEVPKGAR